MGPTNSGDIRRSDPDQKPRAVALALSDSDQMPRSLALTLIAGSLVGAGFWAVLTALLVR